MTVAMTYNFQQQIRDMAPGVSLILQNAPILLGLVGQGEAATQTKFEWQNDYLNSSVADVKTAAAADATEIELKAGEARKFAVNALVQNGLEVFRVTAVDEATDKITVQRGFDTTTPEAIVKDAEIRVISRPRPEGEDTFRKNEINDRLVSENYTQIFSRYAAVSRSQQAVRTYGVEDELNYQVNLRLEELLREANNSLIYGRKYSGSAQQPRTSGGLFAFATEQGSKNVDFANAEITAKKLNDAVEETFKRGGSVNTILCAPNIARQITKLGGSSIQTTRGETSVGHQILAFVSDLPGGAISQVVVDMNMPKDRALMLDVGLIKQRDLTGIYDQDATLPGGDYFSRVIRGEFGWEIRNAKESIAVLSKISPTIA